jgi:hypothetical protein
LFPPSAGDYSGLLGFPVETTAIPEDPLLFYNVIKDHEGDRNEDDIVND